MSVYAFQKKIKGALALATVALLFASPCFAAANMTDSTGLTATAGAAALPQGGDLPTIIGQFLGAALSLLGVVFVVLVIYAGFLWMTAQGNEEKVKQAKKILSQAIIGLILIFSAYVITNTVVSALGTSLKTPTDTSNPGY